MKEKEYPTYDNNTVVEYRVGGDSDTFQVAVCEDLGKNFTGTVISGNVYTIGFFHDCWSKEFFVIVEHDLFKGLFKQLDKLEYGRTT